jgi:hypothetical protein
MEQNARNASGAPHACVRRQALVHKSQASAKRNAHANPWAADALRQPPLLSMCVFRSPVSSTLGAAGDLGAPPTKPRRTTVAACHSPPAPAQCTPGRLVGRQASESPSWPNASPTSLHRTKAVVCPRHRCGVRTGRIPRRHCPSRHVARGGSGSFERSSGKHMDLCPNNPSSRHTCIHAIATVFM